jgi:hypothetical protein
VADQVQIEAQLESVTIVLTTHQFQPTSNGSWVKAVANSRIDVHLEPSNRTLIISQHHVESAARKMLIHVDLLQTDREEWEKVLCCFDA